MRIWVTGAAGFVGKRLCARLAASGAELFGSDRELDVTDAARVRAAVAAARPNAIVHLAAISLVPEAEADPARAFRVNLAGARNVLAAAERGAPDARVLLVTTAALYGSAALGSAGFDESAPLRPATAYARSKASADLLGGVFAARGLDVVRARPFNHTGAGRPAAFVESRIARDLVEIAAGRRTPRLELANPDSQRDFLHVDDVIEAYLALLAPGVPAGAYNVASGSAITIAELAQRLCRLAGVAPEIVHSRDPARLPDATLGVATKLLAATAWRPRRSLDDTLAELLADWRERLGTGAP